MQDKYEIHEATEIQVWGKKKKMQMKRVIGIGGQDFESMRVNRDFYVDKTNFIREWWKGRDAVTLITRPRRFGKTLNMSTPMLLN